MTDLTKRQEAILGFVAQDGFVSTERMVEAFGVTPQTIRRDINLLCERNLLQRFHGGAGKPVSTENEPYSERRESLLDSKRRIGQLVAAHVRPGSSLFLNIGTTTEAVAESLAEIDDLRVVTNNLNVAQILAANPRIEIFVAGGIVRNKDCGIVGHATTEFLSQFQLDLGIIGVSGIDEDGALLDFDSREVESARAIIRNSDRVMLVADHSKFGRRAMIRYGTMDDVDEFYTDEAPPARFIDLMTAAGVTIHTPADTDLQQHPLRRSDDKAD